jgi:hypothetical protein
MGQVHKKTQGAENLTQIRNSEEGSKREEPSGLPTTNECQNRKGPILSQRVQKKRKKPFY